MANGMIPPTYLPEGHIDAELAMDLEAEALRAGDMMALRGLYMNPQFRFNHERAAPGRVWAVSGQTVAPRSAFQQPYRNAEVMVRTDQPGPNTTSRHELGHVGLLGPRYQNPVDGGPGNAMSLFRLQNRDIPREDVDHALIAAFDVINSSNEDDQATALQYLSRLSGRQMTVDDARRLVSQIQEGWERGYLEDGRRVPVRDSIDRERRQNIARHAERRFAGERARAMANTRSPVGRPDMDDGDPRHPRYY